MGSEEFVATGLNVQQKNWLDIYPYDTWEQSIVPELKEGDVFVPSELRNTPGMTKAPKMLSESDLIAQMDENGIGTDATIHEHIKKVQERGYAMKQGKIFKPTNFAVALMEAYEKEGFNIHKPDVRAKMEKGMTEIAEGKRDKNEVLKEYLKEMEEILRQIQDKTPQIVQYLKDKYRNEFD